MPDVAAVLAAATGSLREAGCETPRLDAELLMAETLGVERARLVLDARAAVSPSALARFSSLLARRREREPVAYILGRREFRRLTLTVDRHVLVPRPETELLVEAGLGLPTGARVIDVGTGSGAVALALADERPDLDVWGSDLSAEALAVAAGNAARLRLSVSFVEADLLPPGRFDAVLANLPYVDAGETLPPEVARYEPSGALFGGLDVIGRLVAILENVPFVALEVGFGQAGAVADMLARAGFVGVERLRDLAGIERVVVGRR